MTAGPSAGGARPRPEVDVQVDPGACPGAPARRLEAAARAVLAAEGVAAGEVSLALLDDAAITALNRDHLGHAHPTDVIAFALWDEGEPVVGDVYVGWEQARRQAAEAGVPLDEELLRLVVHGTLHVLGWDHPDAAEEREASPMYRRQEALLAELKERPPLG